MHLPISEKVNVTAIPVLSIDFKSMDYCGSRPAISNVLVEVKWTQVF